jgi:hypothetical protein
MHNGIVRSGIFAVRSDRLEAARVQHKNIDDHQVDDY